MSKAKTLSLLVVPFVAFMVFRPTYAQAVDIQVNCGDIIESEFTDNFQEHFYRLDLNIGDQVTVQAVSLEANSDLLQIRLAVFDASNSRLGETENSRETSFRTDLLRYRGINTIRVQNWWRVNMQNTPLGIGRYSLYVGCTLRTGTIIEPGDTEIGRDKPIDTAFSGFGFPGLAPVDFANVARLPIPAGIPMSGAITPSGNEILGYQFDASEGDTVEIAFNRLSGNLNLGLVVIDENSHVIFQASLVTSETLTSRFTIPTSGQYTAGIFRIDLLPPDSPEATAFQVVATVNP